MGTLDSSIVNVSLPTISDSLNTSVQMVGWVVLSYSIAVFSLLMVFGAISQKKGYQFSYTYGFSIFFVGSLLCGISPNIYMLITSRVIQGIGAAMLVSVGPALITRTFPAEERGRGLSVIAMVVSVGLMLGPPLGGFIIGYLGWRWIFFVNLPVCIMGVIATRAYLSDFPVADPKRKISIPSAITIALGFLALMLSLLLFSRQVIELPVMFALLVLSGVLIAAFFYLESKPGIQLVGIEIFKNKTFVFSGLAMLMVFIALISVTILLPFYLEDVKEYNPEQVGLFLMTVPICMFFMATPAGYLADRFQARAVSSIGIALMIWGLYRFRGLTPEASDLSIVLSLVIMGVGMALFATPNTSSIMGSVQKYQLGSASGMIATIRTLGITLGVGFAIAIFSFFKDQYLNKAASETEAFMIGYHRVYTIMIFIAALAIIMSIFRGRNINRSD